MSMMMIGDAVWSVECQVCACGNGLATVHARRTGTLIMSTTEFGQAHCLCPPSAPGFDRNPATYSCASSAGTSVCGCLGDVPVASVCTGRHPTLEALDYRNTLYKDVRLPHSTEQRTQYVSAGRRSYVLRARASATYTRRRATWTYSRAGDARWWEVPRSRRAKASGVWLPADRARGVRKCAT